MDLDNFLQKWEKQDTVDLADIDLLVANPAYLGSRGSTLTRENNKDKEKGKGNEKGKEDLKEKTMTITMARGETYLEIPDSSDSNDAHKKNIQPVTLLCCKVKKNTVVIVLLSVLIIVALLLTLIIFLLVFFYKN